MQGELSLVRAGHHRLVHNPDRHDDPGPKQRLTRTLFFAHCRHEGMIRIRIRILLLAYRATSYMVAENVG